ncbi:hypothetical protein [Pseudalkalibacillus salsuginis]|nr:hypothetical protein [Pseudalkalibacillus salsuginis]MCF6409324.1 hypothetical protein [Pseudalkalibacillus salsuginis]
MKGLDWQMLAFVTVSLFHDHWVYSRLPRLYYYDTDSSWRKGEAKEE